MSDSDQAQRLEKLAFKLGEIFLTEADPDNWPGAEVTPQQMTKEQRGDRNWQAKNANQMGALLVRVLELKVRMSDGSAPPSPSQPDQADEVRKYEKQATDLLKRVRAKSGA